VRHDDAQTLQSMANVGNISAGQSILLMATVKPEMDDNGLL
jgi:hypothetical protein